MKRIRTKSSQSLRRRKAKELVKALTDGFDDVPLLTRLEYASAIVFNRAGDDRKPEYDISLAVASELLCQVAEMIRTVPGAPEMVAPGEWTAPFGPVVK